MHFRKYTFLFILCLECFGHQIDTFDFIVVGAGAAGCVVAHRLAQEKHTVLLIEAGGYSHPDMEIPAKTAIYMKNPNYMKIYKSVPQSNSGLSYNGVFYYIVGQTLGGGTGVNGMIYNRGSPYDFDNWANMTGDPSWSYDNVLDHFKNIENYVGDFPSEYQHGKEGPITISQPKYAPGLQTWLEAGKELGYKIADPNGPQSVGFAPLEFSRQQGRRVSAYDGYIKPLLEAGNSHLKLITNAKVTKIIFKKNKAVGVEYDVNKEKSGTSISKSVYASKEVILSAGVISSPHILMKSGIGPKDVLDACKIAAVKNLPVGKNLHDHMFLLLQFTVDETVVDLFVPKRDLSNETFKTYEEVGDGPYSSFNGMHGQAFLVSNVRANEECLNLRWPDINLHLVQTPKSSIGIEFPKENLNETHFYNAIMMTRPKSRGILKLNCAKLDDDEPLIDFRHLSHPDDLEAMVDAIKQAIHIHEGTTPYQRQFARYNTNPIHFCDEFRFRSDEYWRCYIRHMAMSGAHAAGTCKMGKREDPEAVVDSKLKVIGVQNLRVADTSIMPAVTNANTQAAAYLIGEKASAEIIFYWKGKKQVDG